MGQGRHGDTYPRALGGDVAQMLTAAFAGRRGRAAQLADPPATRLLTCSPVTLAVPGTGPLAHLEENMAARSITLTPQDLSDLA
ncbi:hypothetical protein [Streptomyces sp. FXY-T5]|uniref:hypothetical protein n=1 Tax=unclassified Streptomyces TaxID=2593676 RepID=UPI00359C4290